MNYEQALGFLYERLPMFQRSGAVAIKKDLTNTVRFLELLNNPHRELKSIHIAGTNGKGTSAHALAAILQSAGYKVGLYTSPHLKSFTERIKVNGVEVTRDFVSEFVSQYQSVIEEISPSFFEVTVVMAFKYFQEEHVDIAIVETGLGGKLDSTNVIYPEVSLITMIGWDHAELLGDSLEKIAAEKAGIIKKGRPVIVGADQPELFHVFMAKAMAEGSELITTADYRIEPVGKEITSQIINIYQNDTLCYKEVRTDVMAGYFLKNIPGVFAVIDELNNAGNFRISDAARVKGLNHVKALSGLKGRWDILETEPFVVADISHNEPGLKELFKQMEAIDFGRLHLVFGVVKDKDLSKILPIIPPDQYYYFTQSSVPRSLPAVELRRKALDHNLSGETYENVNDAILAAKDKAAPSDLILICGSTFVVAEIDNL